MKRWAVLTIAAMATLAFSACTPADREPSASELGLLTSIGDRARDDGVREFSVEIPRILDTQLVDGWIDLEIGIGYAGIVSENSVTGLIIFDNASVAGRVGEVDGDPPIPAPGAGWDVWTLIRQADALDFVLASLLDLRDPIDSVGVRSLGTSEINGESATGLSVTIEPFTGGGESAGDRATYWIDSDGRLLQAEIPVGDAVAVVDFGEVVDLELPSLSTLNIGSAAP